MKVSMKNLAKYLNRETISYLVCGGLTTIVGLVSFAIAIYLGLGTILANTVSTVLAVVFAYITNKIFVFCSRNFNPVFLLAEFFKFCGTRFITFLAETALLVIMTSALNLPDLPSKGFTLILVVVGNYVLSKWIVFSHKLK